MVVSSPIVVGSPKERPLTDQRSARGSRKEQMGQKVTHFGGSQSNEWGGGLGFGLFCRGGQRRRRLHAEAQQEGIGEHDEGDMTIPALVAAHARSDRVRELWWLASPLRCTSVRQWPAPW